MTDLTDRVRPSLVQAGWAIYSRDGGYLGDVLGADRDRLLLPQPENPRGRLELSTELVLEEEPAEMRARISLTEDEVSPRHEQIEPIPRPDGRGERGT